MSRAVAKATSPQDGYRSNLERRYAQHLEARRMAGQIKRWDFEPVNLRLADRTFWMPDFRVIALDDTEEYHETKGFMREDANVKLKVAAKMHPYRFFLVREVPKSKGGGWDLIEYP